MNIKEKKEQVITWVKKNKTKIILGMGGVIVVGLWATGIKKAITNVEIKEEFYDEPSEEPIVPERDILITFTDENSGEVLWKERCYQGYLDDSITSGMGYKEVRELNGIKEA